MADGCTIWGGRELRMSLFNHKKRHLQVIGKVVVVVFVVLVMVATEARFSIISVVVSVLPCMQNLPKH